MNKVTAWKKSLLYKGRRVLQVLVSGKGSTKTAALIQPFGEDCNPVVWKPIYAPTLDTSQAIIIGFVNPAALDIPSGEKHIFSTNDKGERQAVIKLTPSGDMEIGGDSDYLVRFNKLEEGINELKEQVNYNWGQYDIHTHPSSGTPPTASFLSTEVTASIAEAKAPKLKTS